MRKKNTLLALLFFVFAAGCISTGAQKSTLVFEPKQCQQEPWPEPSPTSVEQYYASKGISIDVELLQREGAVCMACGVCPKSYYYKANFSGEPSELSLLEDDGWVVLEEKQTTNSTS